MENKDIMNNDSFCDDKIDKLICLYNSKSGSQRGGNIGDEIKKFNGISFDMFKLNKKPLNNNKIFNIFSNTLIKYDNKCVILICGGDGSIVWGTTLIDNALKYINDNKNISLNYPIWLPLPFGTGNDLCRSTGWGNVNFELNKKNLINLISDIYFSKCLAKRFYYIDRWKVTYKGVGSSDLPLKFLCYLSVGYDAKIAYKWEEDRKNNINKFKSQMKNQLMYMKHGSTELFRPSKAINNSIEIIINNEIKILPENTRSFKLVNINSAMNGLYLWGNGKSKKSELNDWEIPNMNDSKIECMATHGLRDMLSIKMNINHAHRISQSNDIIINIKLINNKPMYLQIDGEPYKINNDISIHVQFNDKLPVLIGYNNPRGVSKWLKACLDDVNINKTRNQFRQRIKNAYKDKFDITSLDSNNSDDLDTSMLDWIVPVPSLNIKSNNNNNDNESDSSTNDSNSDDNSSSSSSVFNTFWNLFENTKDLHLNSEYNYATESINQMNHYQ